MGSFDRLRAVCRLLDLTNGGIHSQYSIKRMCELSDHSQNTSLWRVALVSLLSVIPALLTIVGLDTMPLQDPYAGWDKNSVMWVHIFIASVVLSVGVLFQLRVLAPMICLTMIQIGVISLLLAAVYLIAVLLIAKCWVFPIPFMMVVGNPPWTLTLYASFGFLIGRDKLAANPEVKLELQWFSNLVNVTSLFLAIFPVYSAIFWTFQGVNQFAFIFVLPILKVLLKKLARKVVADVEELVPVVAATVDLFNALFQAKCMQSSGSMWTTVGIISIDAIQNMYTLQRLFRYMAEVQQTMVTLKQEANGSLTARLFVHCVGLLHAPEKLDLRALRIQSLHQTHVLSRETAAILHRLRGLQQQPGCQNSTAVGIPKERYSSGDLVHSFRGVGLNAVVPWSGVPSDQLARGDNQQIAVLQKTLELLWKCESVLLVEYIEAVVPLMYGVSMSILYHLPNVKYYPGMAEMASDKVRSTVSSILLYSALEFGSLLYLHVALKWRFQISALHQLGFVLERQWLSIQGMFLAWVIIALGFTLVHNGTPTH